MSISGENLSIAFEELKNYTYVEKGSASTFDWFHLYNPKDPGKSEVLLREYSAPDTVCTFLEEAQAYTQLLNDPERKEVVKDFQAPLIKYALKQDQSCVEVLQAYCGNPITYFHQRLNNPKNSLVIQFMEKLLRDSSEILNKVNIFHGNLCPDNITYDNGRSKIRFQGGHSARYLDSSKKDYIFKFKSTYYSLSDCTKPLNATNARIADIKALALSIYELGFTSSPYLITSKEFTKEIKGTKVVDLKPLLNAPNHVLNQEKSDLSAIKLKSLLEYILSTNADLTYEIILERYRNEISPTFITGDTFKPTNDKMPFETAISYDPSKMKIRKYKHNVYKIEYYDPSIPSFIIKQYVDSFKRNYEMAVFQRIEEAKSLVSFTKRKMDYKLQFEPGYKVNELVIEYSGLTFPERLQYTVNDKTVMKKVLAAITSIMDDLQSLKMFHCDIKPSNISINEKWSAKLFDYDVSIIDFDPIPNGLDLDADYSFTTRGASIEFSAPELLDKLLGNNSKIVLNPYKADLYSLGKTVICTITHNFTILDILNNLYNLNCKSEIEIINCMKLKLSAEEIAMCDNIAILPSYNDKVAARFYIKHNDVLVKNVANYNYSKAFTTCNIDEYKNIMKFLASLVAGSPIDRPNLHKLRTYSFDYLGMDCTFKLNDLFVNHVSNQPVVNGEYEIKYIEQPDSSVVVYPDYALFKGYYQPIINDSRTSFDIYKISAKGKTYAREEKTLSNSPYVSLSKFIQVLVPNEYYPQLFMVGGCEEYDSVNKVTKMVSGKFMGVNSMAYARYDFGSVSWSNYFAVAGGKGSAFVNADVNDPYLNKLEIYDVAKNVWTLAQQSMSKPRKSCGMAYYSKKLYIIGGIEFVDGNVDAEALVKPFHSKCVDVFSVYNNDAKLEKSVTISHDIYNGICDCICLALSTNEVMIFKDYLLHKIDSDDSKAVNTRYILNITENKASITAKTDEEEMLYTAYQCFNCLQFKDTNLCIPQFMETKFEDKDTSFSILKVSSDYVEMVEITL